MMLLCAQEKVFLKQVKDRHPCCSISDFCSVAYDAWTNACNCHLLTQIPPGAAVQHAAVRKKAIEIINEDRAALTKNNQPIQNLPPKTFLDMSHIDLSWVSSVNANQPPPLAVTAPFSQSAPVGAQGAPVPAGADSTAIILAELNS
jgi:hypothetical protein